MTVAYPLQWPDGWKRTASHARQRSAPFKVSFGKARQELIWDLKRMQAKHVVISTNLQVTRDQLPKEDKANNFIDDPGVAVYFLLRDRQMVMARDAYGTVTWNMRSIALAIEGLRSMERHGGAHMMERAFEGFAALSGPSTGPKARTWWEVFDFDQDPAGAAVGGFGRTLLAGIEVAFRGKARTAHPDVAGGSEAAMQELNAAIEKAREVLG